VSDPKDKDRSPASFCRGEGTAHDHSPLPVRPEAAGLVGNASPLHDPPPSCCLLAVVGNRAASLCFQSAWTPCNPVADALVSQFLGFWGFWWYE
jgi:hypothetical protein